MSKSSNHSVSIVVCCYNSVLRLGTTLKRLSELGHNGLDIDIILIDNASTDGTADFATTTWGNLGSHFTFRVVNEKQPGLSFARNRGIAESKADWILFCDDDNHLRSDYLVRMFDLIASDDKVGIVGGWGIPEFEGEKPGWWHKAEIWYACGKLQEQSGVIETVNGAGMLIRRSLFSTPIFKLPFFLTDRLGNDLISGGDVELCHRTTRAGYKVMFSADSVYGHWIPKGRVTTDYLRKLVAGIGRGFALLKSYDQGVEGVMKTTAKFGYGALRLMLLSSNTFGLSKFDILKIRWDSYKFFVAHRQQIIKNQQLLKDIR